MDTIIAIIFGAVQGLTEFIPVSSSGHLLLLHKVFPTFGLHDEVAFDVALHVGTLAALLLFFWKDCVRYIRAWVKSFSQPRNLNEDQRLAWLILLADVPAAVAGLLFEDLIESTLRSTAVVIVMLVLVAILFFVVEYLEKKKKEITMAQMRWQHALLIGCAQVLSLIPGTSRSGITIVAGMFGKLKRDQAARFSFLIAIPIVAGAGLKKGIDLAMVGVPAEDIPVLVFGMLTAAIVGYLAIAGLLKFLNTRTLKPFAVYRIGLAIVVAILFYAF